MKIFRWFCVLPVAFMVWWFAMYTALRMYGAAMRFCPAENLKSDICVTSWAPPSDLMLFALGGALCTAAVMVAAATVAPAYKKYVAGAAFLLSLAPAVYLGDYTHWTSLAAGIIVGPIAYFFILRHLSRQGTPDERQPG